MSRFAILTVVALTIGSSAVYCQQPAVPPGAAKGAEPVYLEPLPAEALAVPEWSEQFPRVWARGEYLFWAIGTGKLAELGKDTYSSDAFNGLLNAAGKDYGDFVSHMLGNDRPGFRFSAGAWMDQEETVGIEGNFTFLSRSPLVLPMISRDLTPLNGPLAAQAAVFAKTGVLPTDGAKLDRSLQSLMLLSRLGLPAIDPNGKQVVIPFGSSLANGRVSIEIADQEFWMLDLLGRDRIFETESFAIDGLAGYRHIYYRDSFTVRSEAELHSPLLETGTRVSSVDQIRVENGYDGALLGVEFAGRYGGWSLSARPDATIAYLHADVIRSGATVASNAHRPLIENFGGTYLRPEDVGEFSCHQWTVIPELALQLTRSIGEHVRISLGTSLIYLPVAARAADQIELGHNSDQLLPGTTGTHVGRSLVAPNLKSVFLNTYSVGLEVRY